MAEQRRPGRVVELAIGVGVGVYSGLFGVGGGVVLVPIMVGWLAMARKAAHATSLVAVAVLSVAGTISYASHGEVSFPAAFLLVAGGAVGAPIGAAIMRRISERWLGIGFACFLITVAVSMLLGVSGDGGHPDVTVQAGAIFLLTGVLAGALSALLGVGGGVIMIPALVLAGGFGQHLAEGTALAAIGPIAMIGAVKLTFGAESYPRWPLGIRLGIGGIVGAPLGAWLALQLPAEVLQKAFAVLILITAAQLLLSQRSKRASAESDSDPANGEAALAAESQQP